MIPIDFYTTGVSGGYGDYQLQYHSGLPGVKQIGETASRQTAIVQNRFVAADGTPIVYTGYSETTTTLLFECDNHNTAVNLRGLGTRGSFMAAGLITVGAFDGSTGYGTLCYPNGNIETTRITAALFQVSIPVQIITFGVQVPAVRLTSLSTGGSAGFEICGQWIAAADCKMLESGTYQYKSPLYVMPSTTSTHLYVTASVGSDLGEASTILLRGGGTVQSIDPAQAAVLPGAEVALSQGDDTYTLEIAALNAKPLRISFAIRRAGI